MLDISDLGVRYGQVEALKSVSIKIPEGSIFSVLGANGAGKTTLMRAILGLNRANGRIIFDGADISSLPTFERARRGIALVPEGRRIFPSFTIEENLRIGALNRKDRAAVEHDLNEICDIFPILRQRYRQQAQTLSGGEGQMLAIGRALLSRPRLLLLDEPSVGLMPIVITEIFKMIQSIPQRRSITVFIVEQNAKKAIAIADRVAVLELGTVVLEGRADEVERDPRVRKAYLGG